MLQFKTEQLSSTFNQDFIKDNKDLRSREDFFLPRPRAKNTQLSKLPTFLFVKIGIDSKEYFPKEIVITLSLNCARTWKMIF